MKKALVILIHALVGWGLCGAVIGVGRTWWSMETTLIVHVVVAPLIFAVLSGLYFTKFRYTKPLPTAVIFTAIVMAMDAGLVAPVFEKSYDMFSSILGTWLPFALIFTSTWITGKGITKSNSQ
jgi:multisubunit Na+/H+ antiporter MnhC subunit